MVLAGSTRNNEGTTTTGLPGTNVALAPVAPLLGGGDAINNALSETIIFMAPTVIDPSASLAAFGLLAQTEPQINRQALTFKGESKPEFAFLLSAANKLNF